MLDRKAAMRNMLETVSNRLGQTGSHIAHLRWIVYHSLSYYSISRYYLSSQMSFIFLAWFSSVLLPIVLVRLLLSIRRFFLSIFRGLFLGIFGGLLLYIFSLLLFVLGSLFLGLLLSMRISFRGFLIANMILFKIMKAQLNSYSSSRLNPGFFVGSSLQFDSWRNIDLLELRILFGHQPGN